jgi:hypothetical protein
MPETYIQLQQVSSTKTGSKKQEKKKNAYENQEMNHNLKYIKKKPNKFLIADTVTLISEILPEDDFRNM